MFLSYDLRVVIIEEEVFKVVGNGAIYDLLKLHFDCILFSFASCYILVEIVVVMTGMGIILLQGTGGECWDAQEGSENTESSCS